VIIKAASGGGGRGMKVVQSEDQLEALMCRQAPRRRRLSAMATVYIENISADPRHIDSRCSATATATRSTSASAIARCSAATRKVLEEAPLPRDHARRADADGRHRCKAMADMGYRGAGTIEFLYENGEFYFIEMNTRLQVEHPVTEMITGIDLVASRSASRRRGLSLQQSQIEFRGHAIECRINAEDPQTFAPSPGRVKAYFAPAACTCASIAALHRLQGAALLRQHDRPS
jgi:acetyl-CoA carboxylase biotin carboxylase subunit